MYLCICMYSVYYEMLSEFCVFVKYDEIEFMVEF